MTEFKLVLGSGSPRRKELLSGLSYQFEIRTKDTDESFSAEMDPKEVPAHLATRKAEALFNELEKDEIVLCADTVVIIEGEILGKPESRDEAIEMLLKLSGKTHLVITGVFIGNKHQSRVFSDSTEVTFGQLSKAETEFYIDNYKPFDKAGSYGVQEWIGYVAVEKMNGSYTTVMGLPTHLVYKELKNWHI
jgi:septum formation protein